MTQARSTTDRGRDIGGRSAVDDMDPAGYEDSHQDDAQPTEMNDEALLLRMKNDFFAAKNASAKWRKQAREDYGFYSGEQWDQADKARLQEQLRPIITFNRIAPTVDTVAGMEVNNRQEIVCYPRTEGDAAQDEQLSNAVKWVRDDCDAEDEESDMFVDLVVTGMGWTETRLDYERDPDGMIVEERLDPLEMFFDPFANKRNLADARFIMHRKEIDIGEARAMFPDVADADLHADWASMEESDSPHPHDQTEARFYREDQSDRLKPRHKVTIVHAQWFEKEPFYRVADPLSQQIKKLSVGDYRKARSRLKQATGLDLPGIKQTKRVYKRAFLGKIVLEVGDAPCSEDYTFQCVTGKRDRNEKKWYGIVQAMKDPQRWANKFFSTIIHNIATQGKGIISEKDAFDDPHKAESDWAYPDRIIWAKPGAVVAQKIMPKPAGQMPQGLPDMLTFALGSLRDVSGINLEMLGQADRDQAASLEWQRRKSAFSILAAFFDGLRHYRKRQGRLLIWMIQEYISDGRLMRIEDDTGQTRYIPLNRDPSLVEYDVIVDEAPSSPDQKEATWVVIGQMMPLLTKLPIPLPVWMEIIKQSPLPDSFSTKIAGLLQEQAQQSPPPDPQMAKVQAEAQAQAAKLQQDAQLKQAEMQGDMQTEQMRQANEQKKIEAEAQARIVQIQTEAAAKQRALEAEIALEREKAQATVQLEREKMATQMQLEREKMNSEASLRREATEGELHVKAAAVGAKMPRKANEPDPLLTGLKGLADAHREGLEKHTAAIIDQMRKPRKILRGSDGRPIGVE